RHLAATPARFAASEGFARRRLAEDAAVEFPAEAVGVQTVARVIAIGRQFGEPRPKARVEVALEDLCGRTDVRVGIVNAKAVSHGGSPRCTVASGLLEEPFGVAAKELLLRLGLEARPGEDVVDRLGELTFRMRVVGGVHQ